MSHRPGTRAAIITFFLGLVIGALAQSGAHHQRVRELEDQNDALRSMNKVQRQQLAGLEEQLAPRAMSLPR